MNLLQVTNAVNIVQQEWFKVSSTKQSNPLDVEDYLDAIEDGSSRDLLDRVVNLTDVNGNTALHYSVSHGSFDVVSVLLDSKVANLSILNKAGYTCVMLISLAPIATETHRAVVARDLICELFDWNNSVDRIQAILIWSIYRRTFISQNLVHFWLTFGVLSSFPAK